MPIAARVSAAVVKAADPKLQHHVVTFGRHALIGAARAARLNALVEAGECVGADRIVKAVLPLGWAGVTEAAEERFLGLFAVLRAGVEVLTGIALTIATDVAAAILAPAGPEFEQ